MHSMKYYLSIAIVILLCLFIVQNTASVTIDFLFWSAEAPRSLMLFVIFLLGGVTGFLLGKVPGRR